MLQWRSCSYGVLVQLHAYACTLLALLQQAAWVADGSWLWKPQH